MLAGVIANMLIDPFWRLFGFQCKSLILTGAAADLTTEMRMFIIIPSLQPESPAVFSGFHGGVR
jgi:hypothetical protein